MEFFHSAHWLFLAFITIITATVLRWLSTTGDSGEDGETSWPDWLNDHKGILELLIVLPIVALLFTFDFRHLPDPLKAIVTQCTADIMADIVYVIRWPLVVATLAGVVWVWWQVYMDNKDDDLAQKITRPFVWYVGFRIGKILLVVFIFGILQQIMAPSPESVAHCMHSPKPKQ